MYIHGSYCNERDVEVKVEILTHGDRTKEVEIGGEGSDISWSEDPVETSTQVNDSFDVLLMSQASVRLLCRNYVADFFCSSCRDAVVNIYEGGRCVFAGYVEPQAFSQGYNEVWDEVELTCVDALGALQYSTYRNVGTAGSSYESVKLQASQRSFHDIVSEILTGVTENLDISGGRKTAVLYDGSKAIDATNARHYSILNDLSISELLFLGDEEDDVWTQEDVLSEVLRYLNLHIVQDGWRMYVFSWETIRAGETTAWCNIENGTTAVQTTPEKVTVETATVADCDTQISIGETYNQLLLTASVTKTEELVDDPLDSDSLESVYGKRQLLLTEYSADGEGWAAYDGIEEMVTNEGKTTYDGAKVTDWFALVKNHPRWTFYAPDGRNMLELTSGTDQTQLIDMLGKMMCAALIVSTGKVQKRGDGSDNSPTASISMTDYMVITTNGNGKDTEGEYRPSADDIKNAIPCAEYTGNVAGGVLSPADPMVTNYIVISGKMVLNPLMKMTDYCTTLYNRFLYEQEHPQMFPYYWHKTVPSRNNSDGRYYTRKHWHEEATAITGSAWNKGPDIEGNPGFIPYTAEGPQEYEYQYSAYGDRTDKLSKVPILACMLIVGDKCVVEKAPGEKLGTDTAGTGNGEKQDYVWQKYKTKAECGGDDEYYAQSFTIGVDPKIGDKMVGTVFDVQNNVWYYDGIDAEGTAIPVRYEDKVSGQVKFIILGPVNITWEEIVRRHPSFWRHTKWSTRSVPLLAHTSSIMVEKFEVKVVSDNGKAEVPAGDSDIVYMSDTQEAFVNKKDDLEFKITTALTAADCKKLGVGNSVFLSSPLCTATSTPLLSIYNRRTQEQAKPEQHYVNDYWEEWHEPKVLMEQNFMDEGSTVSLFNLYRHPAIGKTFAVQGISRNLTEGTAQVTLKETD